ncbi:MAG: hypothetical protein LM569_01855 [Desulfurococcaceae archaeon]|nr:hypothetical protein [Desulfurococcaceae archaeon]
MTQKEPSELVLWFRSYVFWVKLISLGLLFASMIFAIIVFLLLSSYSILLLLAVLLIGVALVVVVRGLLYTPVVVEVSNNGVFVVKGLLRRRLIYVSRSNIEKVTFNFKQWRQIVLPSRYWLLPLPIHQLAGMVCVHPRSGGVVEFYVMREDIPPLSRALRELGF